MNLSRKYLEKYSPTTQIKLSGQKFQPWLQSFAKGGGCGKIVALILDKCMFKA